MCEPIRIGETAERLAKCFGTDQLLPFPIPVWVADPNCENQPFADELVMLRSAEGDGREHPSYAQLKSRLTVTTLGIFLRGHGYRSPEKRKFLDALGTCHQPAQERY